MKASAILDEASCWKAVVGKDANHDGRFFFGVLTTGVFCRPSCPARRPLRKNVRFYATPEAAARDGLRACLRCRPLDPGHQTKHAAKMREICRYIREHSDEALTLDTLASRAGLSRFHFQRSFTAVVGVSPRQYLDDSRLRRLKGSLRRGPSVTDAIYAAGYGSSSRVYERVDTRLGMTPAQYRAGGKGVTISCGSADTPLGTILIGATDRGLCFVQFGNSHAALLEQLRKEYPSAHVEEMTRPYPSQFDAWMHALTSYLEEMRGPLDLPVDVRATAFQLRVWRYLQSIPAGQVQSYAEVARAIGHPSAARAVARACASNPLAVVIPCHRVIRGDSSLGGYRWGLDRKRVLLDQERAACAR